MVDMNGKEKIRSMHSMIISVMIEMEKSYAIPTYLLPNAVAIGLSLVMELLDQLSVQEKEGDRDIQERRNDFIELLNNEEQRLFFVGSELELGRITQEAWIKNIEDMYSGLALCIDKSMNEFLSQNPFKEILESLKMRKGEDYEKP